MRLNLFSRLCLLLSFSIITVTTTATPRPLRLNLFFFFFFLISGFCFQTPARASCFNPAGNAGDVKYNPGYRTIQYCNGGSWVRMGGTGDATSGLAGWWKVDEGSGTSAADSSGNGNTGTLTNGPTWTTASEVGPYALSLTGSSDQFVTPPDSASLDISGSWSNAAWVKFSALPATGCQSSLINRFGGDGYEEYALAWDNGDLSGGAGPNWLAFSGNVGQTCSHTVMSPTPAPSTGVWYHVASVYDSVAQTLTLYVNGSNVASQSTTGCTPDTQSGGYVQIGSTYSACNAVSGTLDDVRIYNRALSAADVMTLYTSTGGTTLFTAGQNASDALGQYASTVSDATIVYTTGGTNDNNGTTVGALGFNNPGGIALDATHHRLFVSDYYNKRVLVYNLYTNNSIPASPGHTASYVLGQPNFTSNTAALTASGMMNPDGIVYDVKNDRLFVIDEENATDTGYFRVLVYNTATITNGMAAVHVLGQANFTSGSSSAISAKNMFTPTSMAYDTVNDRLFLADLDPNFSRVMVFNVAPGTITDNENASYVLGEPNFTTGANGLTQATFYWPDALAYDSANNRLFVSETGNNRVMVFNVAPSYLSGGTGGACSSGTYGNGEKACYVLGQANYTSSGAATTQAGMNQPDGLAYDAVNNRLFVAESGNNRIMVFNTATITNGMNASGVIGQANFTTGTAGTTQATLSSPGQMDYDSATGRLFVTDQTNNRVIAFTPPALGTACATPVGYAGDLIYNAGTYHVPQYCDGTNWKPLGIVPGAGGAGCTSPAFSEGNIMYNSAYRVVQYCDGTTWRAAGGNTPIPGLVGWWNFDEGSGTSAADSSGSGNTGTLVNSPTWTTGKINQALTFNGTSQYLTITPPSILGTGAATVSAWVYTTGLPSVGFGVGTIFREGSGGALFGTDNTGEYCWDNDGNWSGSVACSASSSVQLNQWQFVTAVRDSSTNVTFYINGVQSGSAGQAAGTPSIPTLFSSAIGGRFDGAANNFFQGTIDDTRVYNRALTASEIWRLYNGAP